ncbi:hypothetical protein F5Y16DRAFT_364316 [Xylariaceae sp. FL0255]|nr:hypothetical protein F5Y16DRAFT_364316 [Xylariaceae sp. FL0255]
MATPFGPRGPGSVQNPVAMATTPAPSEANPKVLNASFVTQTIPDIPIHAGVVAVCTVPEERSGMDDLGQYLNSFLALRSLICGANPAQAQTWLTNCDIISLVEHTPERFVYGSDQRLVGGAAQAVTQMTKSGAVALREDNIQFEASSSHLKEMFLEAALKKIDICKRNKLPLALIFCGPSSLDQDVYMAGGNDYWKISDIRSALGNSINDVNATLITPSLFSAGWQVNPMFGAAIPLNGSRDEFLARQLGGLFARKLVKGFVGWGCPFLDKAKLDDLPSTERFPGPVKRNESQLASEANFKVEIQSCLSGQTSAYPTVSSFSFDENNDEWVTLVGCRQGRGLRWYQQKWSTLPVSQTVGNAGGRLGFLGNAFGGTRKSQVNHIKTLVEDSFHSWPGHWALNWGKEEKQDFLRFMSQDDPDELTCYEIFNILEHRATISILGDRIVQYFGLPVPNNERCRDWDYVKYKSETGQKEQSYITTNFGQALTCFPGPNMPPGVNENMMSKIQKRLESAANYVRASVGRQYLSSPGSGKTVMARIDKLLQTVTFKQAELLVKNPVVRQVAYSWLQSIGMPLLSLELAENAVNKLRQVSSENIIQVIDDRHVEYDVTKDTTPSGRNPNPTAGSFVPRRMPFEHNNSGQALGGIREALSHEEIRRRQEEFKSGVMRGLGVTEQNQWISAQSQSRTDQPGRSMNNGHGQGGMQPQKAAVQSGNMPVRRNTPPHLR